MVETFACSFQATELDARDGIRCVVSKLRGLGVNEVRAGEVQIALAEAVNNVVEHAYAGRIPGEVQIQCTLDNKQLWISICDGGLPLPDNRLPPGHPADISGPVEELPEGGFGWFLIRELTSGIQYQRANDSNELSLCFEIDMSAR